MSLSPEQRVISADDHLDIYAMQPGVWEERLPAALRERGPHVVDTPEGPFWLVEGRLTSPSGRKAAGMLHSDGHGFRPSDPHMRLEDMDEDGIYAHVIYSPTTTALRIEDPALRAACLVAYNDWAAEFNRAAPERLVALGDLPCHEPRAARDELLRVAKLGLRGAIVHQFHGADPIFEPTWDSFWDAVQETGLPISVHLGPGTHSLRPQLGSWRFPAFVAVVPMQLDEVLAGMLFSGTLEKRPRVRLVLGEAGLGWVPYVLERCDHEHHKYHESTKDHRLSMLPSEIFARQVFVTYEDEKLGVQLIPQLGIRNVMWASDYPHGDSTWPHSRRAIASSPLPTLGADALRRIVCDNAAELYGIR